MTAFLIEHVIRRIFSPDDSHVQLWIGFSSCSRPRNTMKSWNSLMTLVLFVGICLAIGGFGAVFTSGPVCGWYPMIHKPSWNPPSWVFGPVWTFLYLMMGTAAWSPLFFGLNNPLAGLLDSLPLWAAILMTIIFFWRVSPVAGWLMVPYWLWVSFATALNFALWRKNL